MEPREAGRNGTSGKNRNNGLTPGGAAPTDKDDAFTDSIAYGNVGVVLKNDVRIPEYGKWERRMAECGKWERRYVNPPNRFSGDETRGGTRGAGELV